MRTSPIGRILLGAIVVACASTSPSAQLLPAGQEFQINTYTTNTQGEPAVAVDPWGNFVVVWESFGQDGSGFGVFGRRYEKSGTPLGGEFQVNTFTTGNQYSPILATDPSGGFVVLWESFGQDGSGFGVFGRRFDKTGTPLGAEFQVNSYTTINQVSPSLTMDAWGNFVVVWGSDGQDGSEYGVFGQRFDRTGNPRGSEFQVSIYTALDQFPRKTAVSSHPSGDFVVVWQSTSQGGSGSGIFGRRYDDTGASQGGEVQINTYSGTRQRHAAVAVHASGNFMVIWESFLQDTSSWGVFGQRFNSSGDRQGGEFQVNTETYSGQVTGTLGVDAEGRFVVVWYSFLQDGSDQGIFGQRYYSNGAPAGAEFQINTFTTGEQNLPWVGVDSTGDFVVAWYSFAQDGSDLGIFGQRYSCSPAIGPVTDLDIETSDGGNHLAFTWSDATGAADYVVLEDLMPYGAFGTVCGTATSGATGLTLSSSSSDLRYYRVAGRNPTCGLGPLR